MEKSNANVTFQESHTASTEQANAAAVNSKAETADKKPSAREDGGSTTHTATITGNLYFLDDPDIRQADKLDREILASIKWLPELPVNVPRRYKKVRDSYNPIEAGVKNVQREKEDYTGFKRKVKCRDFGGRLAVKKDSKDAPRRHAKENIKKVDPDRAKYLKYLPEHFLGINRSRSLGAKNKMFTFPKEEVRDSAWRVGHVRFNPSLSFLGAKDEGYEFENDHFSSSSDEENRDESESEQENGAFAGVPRTAKSSEGAGRKSITKRGSTDKPTSRKENRAGGGGLDSRNTGRSRNGTRGSGVDALPPYWKRE